METSWHESFADRYAEWSAGRTGERTEYVFVARHRRAGADTAPGT